MRLRQTNVSFRDCYFNELLVGVELIFRDGASLPSSRYTQRLSSFRYTHGYNDFSFLLDHYDSFS